MKKFFAAIVMVCLIGAFSNQAMAQGPHRDNGRPGQKPAAVNHQPAPGNHVGAVQAPRHAKPAPPPHHAKPVPPPHHAKPVPPPHHGKPLPPPHHAKPVPPPPPAPHHARPLPPPEPAVGYRPGNGLYIGIGPVGIRIPL